MILRALLLACLMLLAGPVAALERVSLQLKWKHQFQFAGYYAAKEKGFYREAGLDVDLREPASADSNPVTAVVNGQADFGIGASDLVLERSRGKPVVALAVILQHSPLVLLARSDLDTVQDLVGKRVMLLPYEMELFAYLIREGLTRKQIQEVPHSFQLADLIAGRVDAISGYSTDEPFDLKASRIRFNQFSPRSLGIDFYGDTLFTSEAKLDSQPAQVEAFRQASLKGWQYALAHPDEIIDLILKRYTTRHSRAHLEFEAAEMRRLMSADLVEIGQMNPGRWQHIAEVYAELGLMPEDYSLTGFLYDTRPSKAPAWIMPTLLTSIGLLTLMALLIGFFIHLNRRLRQALKQRDEALLQSQNSEERLRLALECTGDGVWDWNIVDSSAHYSDGWWSILGYTPKSLHENHQNFITLVHPEDRLRIQEAQERHWHGETPGYRCEFRMRAKDGGWRWILSRGMLWARTPDGKPLRMLGTHLDITERRLAESALAEANSRLQVQLEEIQALQAQLADRAIRDALTGLFNRRYLDETLEREVARARREGHPLSVVMLDLDHFKDLNDSYGHQAGDQVIKTVADLLREDTRTEDVVCRYGGEEFLVVLPGMSLDSARERAESWRQRFASIDMTFGNFDLKITGSFGVAGYPQHGKTPDALTHAADLALYQAKHGGRNRVEVYDLEPITFVAHTPSC